MLRSALRSQCRLLVGIVLVGIAVSQIVRLSPADATDSSRRYSLGRITMVLEESQHDLRGSGRIGFPHRNWKERRPVRSWELRFRVGGGNCFFDVRVRQRGRASAERSAIQFLRSDLQASGRYVLAEGRQGPAAYRVVRLPTRPTRISGPQIRAEAGRAIRVATPAGALPEGEVAWHLIFITANSTKDSDCQAGSPRRILRDPLARALGGATTRVRFVHQDELRN